ncbi:Outer membrane protein W precursor [Tritonibacter multivorans]|uniref:Outer membrane protein W n=1 Tax=Tritonibacter multivorans TaxID=928856 RepID=A0A0P1GF74_9RHOB|nr:OmpW family outer membrane protein [Tritonibacter multivorans]MDA7420996.1 outer membrane beta-barrel protein [Tritonibacter multivorans]CUH80383.1 Outer membrane protein W precursor [Tritonibacter multivorans]SFC79153.1 outer membrane protein [Tritonibacter multivorans]
MTTLRKLRVSAFGVGAVLASTLAVPAVADSSFYSQGSWHFGAGVINVNPKSDNGTVAGADASIGSDTAVSLTAEYFIRDNIGIELLAATPFDHDIALGGSHIGSTKHLPPTLSVNYHFPTKGKFTPFVGLGVNYTTFFEEETPLGTLELDDSFGLAASLGADWQITDHGALRVNVRYMDIDTDASLNGADIGTAEIDPITVGVSYIHRF